MSSPTSTPADLSSEFKPYGRRVWRLVEGQHRVSTMKLVDSLAEQSILEDLVEETKPALPRECEGLDYLLYTPFRYGPYKYGSRFRRAGHTPGVLYATEDSRTAASEKAFYRLLFFVESPNTPSPVNPFECTGFSVEVRSPHLLDLTKPPFDADAAVWRHPVDYGPCQDLAAEARKAGAELLRYQSARDPAGGVCIAVLTCAAFVETSPKDRETWWVGLNESRVYAIREFPRFQIEFDRTTFASDPRIAAMGPTANK
jgi:RES domain